MTLSDIKQRINLIENALGNNFEFTPIITAKNHLNECEMYIFKLQELTKFIGEIYTTCKVKLENRLQSFRNLKYTMPIGTPKGQFEDDPQSVQLQIISENKIDVHRTGSEDTVDGVGADGISGDGISADGIDGISGDDGGDDDDTDIVSVGKGAYSSLSRASSSSDPYGIIVSRKKIPTLKPTHSMPLPLPLTKPMMLFSSSLSSPISTASSSSPMITPKITISSAKSIDSKISSLFNNTKEVAPGVKLHNINVVYDESSIPNTQLYWLESSREFAVKIAGCVFRGHIGEIYPTTNKRSGTAKSLFKNVTYCKHGAKCQNILSKCSFYHDPKLLEADEIKDQQIKNYTNGNWVYSDEPKNSQTDMMRHIGSRNRLMFDLKSTNGRDFDNWMRQTIHCILVGICMQRYLQDQK
jgi:hypothetical protein